MTFIKRFVALGLALLIQACATGPKYTPMTQQTLDSIGSLESYNLVIQDEVTPAVELSNVSGALGGGLIAAAIDSSVNDGRATTSRDTIQPLYNEISDLDYRALIVEELNPVLIEDFNLSNPNERAEAVILKDKEITAKISRLKPGEAFLFLTNFYQFREQFQMLQTSTTAFLYLANSEKPSVNKPDYHNTVIYQSELVGSGGAASVAEWAKDDAKLFREKIARSVQASKDMLRYDMRPIVNEKCEFGAQVEIPNILNTQKIKGHVLKQVDHETLIRNVHGGLYTVSNASVKKTKVKTCKALGSIENESI